MIDGLLERQNSNLGMVKENRAKRSTWRDEIRGFAGVSWNIQAADKYENRRLGRLLSCSGLIEADDDDDDDLY